MVTPHLCPTRTPEWVSELPPTVEDLGGGLARGRLPDGRRVLVRRLGAQGGAPPEERVGALRRLAGIRDAHLVSIRGAVAGAAGVTLLADWEQAETLAALQEARHHFDAVQVAAIGFQVLRGLAALQRAGLAYGRVGPEDVLVTASGRVKLAGSSGDVRSAGELLAGLLGPEAESGAPALVVTARSLAAGAAGRSPAHALALWRDAAGMAGSDPARAAAARELGAAVRRHRSAVGRAVTDLLARSPEASQRSVRVAAPGLALTLAGLALVLLSAFALAGAARAARPAAAAPHPAHAGSPAAAAAPTASSPDDAVRRFYQLVAARRYDAAAVYCTPRLLAANPPAELAKQYGDASSIKLLKDQVVDVNQDAGIANVAVSFSYNQAGSTHTATGNLYLADGPSGWRIDRYNLS